MKRTLAILIVTALLMSLVAVSAYGIDTDAYTPEELVELKLSIGDVDGDSVITTTDARNALRLAAGLDLPQDDETMFRAAVTGGEECNTSDARAILRAAAGIEGIRINLTSNEIMTYYSLLMTRVKTTKPGFTRDVTTVCPSIKTTLPNSDSYSILGLNYTEPTELSQMSTDIDALINRYNALLKVFLKDDYDQFMADWQEQKAAMAAMYEPHVENRVIDAGSSYHYSAFPLKGLTYGCLATGDDVTACKLTRTLDSYVIEFKLGEYSCGPELPEKMSDIPYGKVFDVPARSSYTGSKITLNDLTFKNGTVVCRVDIASEAIVSVDHSYTYVFDFTQEYVDESSGATDTMRTIQTVDNTLKYAVNAVVPEV